MDRGTERHTSINSRAAFMKPTHVIPFAIIAGGAIVAFALYASVPKGPSNDSGNAALLRPVGASDHILGNPAAKVVIVEYSDFDCQYCKTFDETLHQVIANEGTKGEVAWTFRQFPLIEIHPNALSHAKASECAAEVGGNEAFWKFKDVLFANQPVNPSRYGELAAASGISGTAFASCYANPPQTLTDRIMADRQNAFDIGAGGTPYSIILVDGRPKAVIESAYPYEEVQRLVNEALGTPE